MSFSKKITASFIDRWASKKRLDAACSPFGQTAEGFQDFRGLPMGACDKVYGKSFSRCDFSFANFSDLRLEGLTFDGCCFERAEFSNAIDCRNKFENCIFKSCRFVDAAFGIYTTEYTDCRFEECNFRNASFQNPVFRGCCFENNKLNKTDFSASGFWNCEFVGDLFEVTFRGGYLFKMRGKPKSTGLHCVDFREAHLSWVSVTSNCPLEQLKLPAINPVVVCNLSAMIAGFDAKFLGELSLEERIAARQFLSYSEPWADGQLYHILCLGDMVMDCGEKVGNLLFEYALEHRAKA